MRQANSTERRGRLLPVAMGALSLLLIGKGLAGCGTAHEVGFDLTIVLGDTVEADELRVSVSRQKDDEEEIIGKPHSFDFPKEEGERAGRIIILLGDHLIGKEVTLRAEALLNGARQGGNEQTLTVKGEGLAFVELYL